jgi:hypothetical protein
MESYLQDHNIVNRLINAFPGNISVNTVQHANIEEAVLCVRGEITQLWVFT